MEKPKDIRLTFSNYNPTFNEFYESYKETCLEISKCTKISEIGQIRRAILTFMSEYEYTIDDEFTKQTYRNRLKELREKAEQDESLVRIYNKDFNIISNKIEYSHKYYEYFLLYLDLFGKYVSEMTVTFMPNTTLQKKHLKFSNNQIFFERFTQHKKIVVDSMKTFDIYNFNLTYNTLITFYYAYSLFINNNDKMTIEKLFSLIISFFLRRDNLNLLLVPKQNLSATQMRRISNNSNFIYEALLYINSTMNHSFSSYDVLPKIQKRIYSDRTLI